MSDTTSLSERIRQNRAAGKAPPVDLRSRVFDGTETTPGTPVPAALRDRLRDPENTQLPVDRPGVSAQATAPTRRPAAPTVPDAFRKPEWEVVPHALLGDRQGHVCITIERGGARCNVSAAAMAALGLPTHVVVRISRNPPMIALEPVDERRPEAVRLRQPKPTGYRTFPASGVTWRLGLDVSRTLRYPARIEGGMLVADLSPEAGTDVTVTPRTQQEG